jgi:hypothetical protein
MSELQSAINHLIDARNCGNLMRSFASGAISSSGRGLQAIARGGEGMTDNFQTNAEQRAESATRHEAFAVNLVDVRRTVSEILSQIGRFGFFDFYTKHDIVHVDEMLAQLDWLVPDTTKKIMSDADWFITVLSIYFHDLGLMITKEEFARRDESGFRRFCDDRLFSGEDGEDYRAKVQQLTPWERERFLYEEFVRFHHGHRVRCWIENRPEAELGYAAAAIKELDTLLIKLSPLVRRDIGLLCESHNLDDLEDLKKYKVTQPYGNSDAETANLHYGAILLRTVDLLQITRQRAPAVLYRVINPTDPVSQREWAIGWRTTRAFSAGSRRRARACARGGALGWKM